MAASPAGSAGPIGRRLRRAGARLRRPWVLALVLLVGSSGLAVLAAHEDGYSAQAVDLGAGSVWVASNGPGQLALLDGASAEITVKLRVAQDADDVVAVTGSGAGYAVNRTTGTLLRVDNATWQVSDAHVLIDGSTGGLTAIADDQALFVADNQRGLAIRADPTTLEPAGEPRSLSAIPGPGSPVLDSRGVLWLLDAQRGNLVRMTDTPQVVRPGIADPVGGRLVLVDDRPVVVDLAAGTATPIDPDDGSTGSPVCVDVDAGDATVHVLGASTAQEVYAVSGADGVLRITDLDTGDCSATVPGIAPSNSDLGQPVAAGRHVFVPDYGTGQVIVVDLDARTARRTQALVEPGADFDLIGHDGFAFYNQRTSNRAGVIDPDGSVRTVPKYDVDDPQRGLFDPTADDSPVPSPDTEPPDATTADASAADPTTTAADPGPVVPVPSPALPPTGTRTPGPTSMPPTAPSATPTSTPTAVRPTPSSTVVESVPTTTSSVTGPTTTSDTTTDSTSKGPTLAAPQVQEIKITSRRGEPYLHGDTLTFSATFSGGPATAWSWKLEDLSHGGGRVNEIGTAETLTIPANSGGQSTDYRMTLVATNDTGSSDPAAKTFTVTHTNNNPVTITDFHASAAGAPANNIGLSGQNIALMVTTTGAPFSCTVDVTDGSGSPVGTTTCNSASLTFPVGTYHAIATATPREGDAVTQGLDLTIYPDPVLTVAFGGNATGSVTGVGDQSCTATCVVRTQLGAQLTLVAAGGATATWTGCDSVAGTSCQVTMLGPKSPAVVFTDTSAPAVTLTGGGSTATVSTAGASISRRSGNPSIAFTVVAGDGQSPVTRTSLRYFVDSINCVSDDGIGTHVDIDGDGTGIELSGASGPSVSGTINLTSLAVCRANTTFRGLTVRFWATATSSGGVATTKDIAVGFSP